MVLLFVIVLTTVARWQLPVYYFPFDLFLILTVVIALRREPMPTQLYALVIGLVQDSFTGNLIGLNALSKTVLGFTFSVLKNNVDLKGPIQRFLVFVFATLINEMIIAGVKLTFSLTYSFDYNFLCLQLVGNAMIGLLVMMYLRHLDKRYIFVREYERA